MRFENRKGPKGEKKNCFVSWNTYFSSCYFFITTNYNYNYNNYNKNL